MSCENIQNILAQKRSENLGDYKFNQAKTLQKKLRFLRKTEAWCEYAEQTSDLNSKIH